MTLEAHLSASWCHELGDRGQSTGVPILLTAQQAVEPAFLRVESFHHPDVEAPFANRSEKARAVEMHAEAGEGVGGGRQEHKTNISGCDGCDEKERPLKGVYGEPAVATNGVIALPERSRTS
jgi:hypothetical protein